MPFDRSLRDDVNALVSSKRIRNALAAHARSWRQCPTPYTIENTTRLAADEERPDDLHDTVLDERFRHLRQSMFGVNALRGDLHVARSYFLTRQPDFLRYVQVLLLEQHPFGTPESALAQEHCREYADFLQLDRLPHERTGNGLPAVLGRAFRDSAPSASRRSDGARLRLAGYELGEWTCSCGRLTGLARRYDHACPCGAVSGNGRITGTTADFPCSTCTGPIGYAVCPACGTRVTLTNLWRLRNEEADAYHFTVPLTLDLVVEDPQGTTRHKRLQLMDVPLPLGVRERNGEIVFDAPAVFWDAWASDHREGDRFLGLKDMLRYDGRTQLGPLLEAALRRTLLTHRGSYARFRRELIWNARELSSGVWWPGTRYTLGFWLRLRGVGVSGLGIGDLVGHGGVSAQVTVVASPRLQGTAVLVNERLSGPDALTVPTLHQVGSTLCEGACLTARPPFTADEHRSSLEPCGLATPGRPVLPGQLLVGAASPLGDKAPRTPEERLLAAIFRDDVPKILCDTSLRMPGRLPGHVLQQRITGALATDSIPAAPGRHLTHIGNPQTRLSITVAVDQPLQHGDALDDEAGARAVVCGVLGGPALRHFAGSPDEPDLIVAPDHPWAPPAGESTRTVRVRLAAHGLAGPDTGARSVGNYSLINQPLQSTGGNGAQIVEPEDFKWLVGQGARHLAMELYGPRSDCTDWRRKLRAALESGGGSLCPPGDRASDLSDAPPYAVRRLDLTLRGARIEPHLDTGAVRLRPMTDADVIALSYGEVLNDSLLDLRTGRPVPGGLLCPDIFGPHRDDECVCGKRHRHWDVGQTCAQCGRTLVSPEERGRRFGHIELPAPVVHPWYLSGEAGTRLARSLRVTEEELRQIVHCDLLLVIDPGPTTLRTGQLVDSKQPVAPEEWPSLFRRNRATTVTGGAAVRFLLDRAAATEPATPSPDAVLLQRLPVLPPTLRPHIRAEDGRTWTTDLNTLYLDVLQGTKRFDRLNNDWILPLWLDAHRFLQSKIDSLLDNARKPEPFQNGNGRALRGLADSLLSRPTSSTGPLRDDFLRRSVDYSARARLVIGRLLNRTKDEVGGDPSTVTLGRNLVLRLLEPKLMHALVSSGAAERPGSVTRSMIENRSEEALRLLDTVCERSLLLVAFPYGPRRLVALRPRADETPALQVAPGLLDVVGWENLGEPVRIFSVLTDEAFKEATQLLTLDAPRTAPAPCPPRPSTPNSFFDLPCAHLPARLADAALTGDALPIAPDDGLLLCDPDWLSPHGP
ncbi:hypothetical protein ACF08M_30045 [Streptomyces sp. NPDC015032]|uniref:hypothetical protein n=1 Tax=Streptomyces sp. NPDC015032 TaxID=3364937 RepID=UPI003701AA49